ncbi:MAG: hypothetical protein QOG28_2181 [Trebonia sp.]|nr:hypothetical protein [Trebonia sp.]
MQLASQRLKRYLISRRKIIYIDLPVHHRHHAFCGKPVTTVGADRGGRHARWDMRRLKLFDHPYITFEVVSSRR